MYFKDTKSIEVTLETFFPSAREIESINCMFEHGIRLKIDAFEIQNEEKTKV